MNISSTLDQFSTTASELARARSLVESADYAGAVRVYETLLSSGLSGALRLEAQANLAAALCALAQDERTPRETALHQLDLARHLQTEILLSFDPQIQPHDWASGRANLALIHLSRHKISGGDQDVLLAHLALDGVELALRRTDDTEMLGWVGSIRDHLLDLRDRRTKAR